MTKERSPDSLTNKNLLESLRQQNEKLILYMAFVRMHNLEPELDAFEQALYYMERTRKLFQDD
jgi:hypothetical protein